MEKYKIIRKLGEGAFGEVLLSQNVQSGETVALKKIFLRRSEDGIPVGVWREGKALQHAEHANVIKLQETFAHGSSLVLVMDCMACSLADVLRETDGQLEEGRAKAYALEILRGIAYVHSLGIIHRDLKPGNILLGEHGAVKLADFGLARVVAQEGRENSYQAATRWYRAPELLFSARSYGAEVDVWSLGCILAELVALGPIFPGETDIDQLYRVLSARGTSESWLPDWPEASSLPDFHKISFSPMPPVSLRTLIPAASNPALTLLDSLLQVPPRKRLSSSEALEHAWFSSLPFPAPLRHYPLPRAAPDTQVFPACSVESNASSQIRGQVVERWYRVMGFAVYVKQFPSSLQRAFVLIELLLLLNFR